MAKVKTSLLLGSVNVIEASRDIYGWFSIDWMCLAVSLGFAQHVVQSVSQGLKLHNANLQFLESWLSGILGNWG